LEKQRGKTSAAKTKDKKPGKDKVKNKKGKKKKKEKTTKFSSDLGGFHEQHEQIRQHISVSPHYAYKLIKI
jgi:hypothetical protein